MAISSPFSSLSLPLPLSLSLSPSSLSFLTFAFAHGDCARRYGYVSGQLKTAMLMSSAFLAKATRELCTSLAAIFDLVQCQEGHTLYSASDRPDCAYLIISGEVTLLGPPAPPRKGPNEWVAPAPDDEPPPVVVATRTKTSEVPWAGEGALFSRMVAADPRRGHSAITTRACQLLMLPRSRFGEFERLAGGVLLPALKRADTRLNERIASFTPEEEDFLVVLEQMHASDFARATIAAAKAESRSPLAAAGLPDNVQDQS